MESGGSVKRDDQYTQPLPSMFLLSMALVLTMCASLKTAQSQRSAIAQAAAATPNLNGAVYIDYRCRAPHISSPKFSTARRPSARALFEKAMASFWGSFLDLSKAQLAHVATLRRLVEEKDDGSSEKRPNAFLVEFEERRQRQQAERIKEGLLAEVAKYTRSVDIANKKKHSSEEALATSNIASSLSGLLRKFRLSQDEKATAGARVRSLVNLDTLLLPHFFGRLALFQVGLWNGTDWQLPEPPTSLPFPCEEIKVVAWVFVHLQDDPAAFQKFADAMALRPLPAILAMVRNPSPRSLLYATFQKVSRDLNRFAYLDSSGFLKDFGVIAVPLGGIGPSSPADSKTEEDLKVANQNFLKTVPGLFLQFKRRHSLRTSH